MAQHVTSCCWLPHVTRRCTPMFVVPHYVPTLPQLRVWPGLESCTNINSKQCTALSVWLSLRQVWGAGGSLLMTRLIWPGRCEGIVRPGLRGAAATWSGESREQELRWWRGELGGGPGPVNSLVTAVQSQEADSPASGQSSILISFRNKFLSPELPVAVSALNWLTAYQTISTIQTEIETLRERREQTRVWLRPVGLQLEHCDYIPGLGSDWPPSYKISSSTSQHYSPWY